MRSVDPLRCCAQDVAVDTALPAHTRTRLYRPLFLLATGLLGLGFAAGFVSYLQQHRQLPWIHYNLYLTEADAAYERGDYPTAMAQYRKITVLDPGDFQASVRLGMAAAAAGRTDEALAAFDHALAINPACGDCRHRKGIIYMTEWWRGDPVAELDTAAALAPGNPAIWSDLGVARVKSGDRTGARDAFIRALTLQPNLRTAQENLARLESGS